MQPCNFPWVLKKTKSLQTGIYVKSLLDPEFVGVVVKRVVLDSETNQTWKNAGPWGCPCFCLLKMGFSVSKGML